MPSISACPKTDRRKRGLVAPKPANMTFEEAAAVPGGGITALHVLRKADLQPGQKVLIYGASGSVGTYAVQLARYYGAQVTGACSTRNVEQARSLSQKPNLKGLQYVKELLEAGKVTPVIDRCYPLYELPDALCYLQTGRARAKL